MDPAPPPKSLLGRHRMLAPTAAVKVSPLCIGAMNFGDAWESFLGAVSKEDTFKLLDYFHSQGGNFIDTANNYQNEQSELWIGEWLASRPGIRDQMVIATKFTTCFTSYQGHDNIIHSNNAGNGAKSLHVSLRNSLKKLQTDYVDLLYVHWWDFTTSIPELMTALNTVCEQGKVLYLGISDTPAWVVSKANQYARDHGLRQFVVYQGQWSAANRSFERDILHMVADEGMSLAPWGSLGGGSFKTKAQREQLGKEGRQLPASPAHEAATVVLDEIAKAKKTQITSVAMAYVMHKAPYVFPIVGGRKIEHIQGNIEALSLILTDEEIKKIDGAYPFDLGFPMNMLGGTGKPQDVGVMFGAGHFDYVDKPKPIAPPQSLGGWRPHPLRPQPKPADAE